MKATKNARAEENADVSDYYYMNEWPTMIGRNMQQTIDIQAFELGENEDNRPTINNYIIL
mgnify:CR=1 FL=1|jgi:hypothetical protein